MYTASKTSLVRANRTRVESEQRVSELQQQPVLYRRPRRGVVVVLDPGHVHDALDHGRPVAVVRAPRGAHRRLALRPAQPGQ